MFAAIFLRDLRAKPHDSNISVDTAGCFAGNTPRNIERRCREAAERRGLELDSQHQSRKVTAEELPQYDLIVVMNEANFWHLKRLDPTLDGTKVPLLMEFTEQLGLREMPDPVQGQIDFDEALDILEKASPFLLAHVVSFFKLS